jgi:hypothetical protein
MLRTVSEIILEKDDEFCACLTVWQKTFDGVKWAKLMQIIEETDMDWRDRRLISKLYMDQSVKERLEKEETRSVRLEEGLDNDVLRHRFCSTDTSYTLPTKLLKGLETSE